MSSKFEISYAKLGSFSNISTGRSSKVQKATLTTNGSKEDVATKTYVDFKESEIHILANLNHKNVITFIGAVMEHDKKILVMEYAPDGNLYEYLRKQNKRLGFEHSMEWAKQCSSAVAYLHSQTQVIIHRDIKSHNFLLSADFTDEKSFHVLKLCDFGISHQVKDSKTSTRTVVGGLSLKWAAPEVILEPECCSIYCDVYSLAVVIWELFTLQIPYEGLNHLEIQNAICNSITPNTESISCQDVSQLLQRCWRKEKSDRPKAGEVVEELSKMNDDDVVPDSGPDTADGVVGAISNISLYESVEPFTPRNSQPASPDRVVKDLELQELTRYLGNNWKLFGRILGYMKEEIDVFYINNQVNIKDAMYDMLHAWKAKFGKEATVGKLVDHLDHFEHINPEYYQFLINDTMKD